MAKSCEFYNSGFMGICIVFHKIKINIKMSGIAAAKIKRRNLKMSDLQPVKLKPAFKDYLWGGTRLKTEYNKKSDLDIVAESWELSTHKDGQSVISGGKYDGMSLSSYIEKIGRDKLGRNALKFDYFPLLIKFIDAKKDLSIQVHPDDKYAMEHEGEYGKTEMWYIMDCEEGAFLYYGFDHEITKAEFEKRIADNTLVEVLNKVEVKKGDVFFIPSGTVHAICSGIVICEIQQNSNTTYRVYDYDRRDANGNPRQLHIKQAVDVAELVPSPKQEGLKVLSADDKELSSCKYFTVRKIDVKGEKVISVDDSCFRSVIVTDGNAKLTVGDASVDIAKGDSVFVPAQNTEYKISGNCEIILSYV
jgi:mannose-6-phosphate isomerase